MISEYQITQSLDTLRQELTWARERPPESLYQYNRLARNFLLTCPSIPPTTTDVQLFINSLQAQNSRRLGFYVCKALCRANNWPWDDRRLKVPPVGDTTVHILSNEIIEFLIKTACSGYLDERKTAYLCLSTVYGFRRSEMAALTQANFNNGHVTVRTVKRGLIRSHVIPDSIRPYLEYHNFEKIDPSNLSRMFNKILRDCFQPSEFGEGWHSIRSALISGLSLSGVPDAVITKWIGWRSIPTGSGVSKMLGIYVRPPTEQVDSIVFEKHPFLHVWS